MYVFSSSDEDDGPYINFNNRKKHENEKEKHSILVASSPPKISEDGSLPTSPPEPKAKSKARSDPPAASEYFSEPEPAAHSLAAHFPAASEYFPEYFSEPEPAAHSQAAHSPNLSRCEHGHFICQSAHHEGVFSILFNKQQHVRKKQNQKIEDDEGLSVSKPDHQIKTIIDSVLMPQRVNDHRCATCKVCLECSPIENLTRKQKLDILLKRESPTIMSNTQVVNDPTKPGFLKIIARLPSTGEGGLKDRASVIKEFDKKMLKLAPNLKQSLQAELDKAMSLNYVSKLMDLPELLKEKLMEDPRFVSTVPAFKEGESSTPARICTNFSAGRLSENDTALTGKIQINLEKTCRSFKSHSHVASLDVKKFFWQVSLSTEDMRRHLFIWRRDLDPANPPEIYCFMRLCFGHTSSSLISEEAVRKISHFGELICCHCDGNY